MYDYRFVSHYIFRFQLDSGSVCLDALAIAIVYVGDTLAFMVLRFKRPEWNRPFKLPGGISIGILGLAAAIYCVNWFAYATDTRGWILFGAYILVGFIILLANRAHLKHLGVKPEFISPETSSEDFQTDIISA